MSMKFLRRSLLYIPGSSLKMIGKASGVTSDAVIFDLEDAVSIGEKDAARGNVVSALPTLIGSGKEIIVRVNAMDTLWGYQDLLAVIPKRPDAVILPKADERGIITADAVISAIEQAQGMEIGTVKVIPLFETAYAIANAYQVLGAAARIDGVQLGAEDLTKEQEIVRTSAGSEILYARQQLAMAARARKIDIIDTPFTGVRDLEGLHADAALAKSIGFTGKTCIHPSHIETINSVFSPGEQEVETARGIVEALAEAVAAGKGACMYQGKMVDAPVAERAHRILAKAELIAAAGRTE